MNEEHRWAINHIDLVLRERLVFERQVGAADVWRDTHDGQLCVVYAAGRRPDEANYSFVGDMSGPQGVDRDVRPHTPHLQCVLWELIYEDPRYYEANYPELTFEATP